MTDVVSITAAPLRSAGRREASVTSRRRCRYSRARPKNALPKFAVKIATDVKNNANTTYDFAQSESSVNSDYCRFAPQLAHNVVLHAFTDYAVSTALATGFRAAAFPSPAPRFRLASSGPVLPLGARNAHDVVALLSLLRIDNF